MKTPKGAEPSELDGEVTGDLRVRTQSGERRPLHAAAGFLAASAARVVPAFRALVMADLPSGITSPDYLVGTANAGLSAEIVVGTAPGGELGGTWAAPTVDATHSGSAHHAQSHGAADHTDRTRRVTLIPGAATIAVGTPDLAIRGANLRYAAWAFDAAADEVVNFTFTLPDDYVSSGQFLLWWSNGGGGAGNVVWAVRARGIADAGDLNTTAGETAVDDTIAAPLTNIVTASLHSAAPTFSAGQMVRLNIGRLGTNVADTLGNDAWLLHVDFRYTADM